MAFAIVRRLRQAVMRHMPTAPVVRTLSVSAATRAEQVTVVFVSPSGERYEAKGRVGQNILDVAIENDVNIEGACGGTLACSTCHVVVDEKSYAKLDKPDEEELDMLDLAFGLTNRSRLGCQITLTKALDGIVCQLPEATADIRNI